MLFDDRGQRIDLKGNSSIAQHYREKVKELQNYKFPLLFKTRFSERVNVTGEREPSQSINVLFEGYVNLPDGSREKIRYSNGYPIAQRSGRFEYPEKSGDLILDSLIVGKGEMDKAYFLMYICPTVRTGGLKLENKQAEAESRLEAGSRMAVLWYTLTDEDSPLYPDEDRVRKIALSLGVSNALDSTISLAEVKASLIRHVEQGEVANSPHVNVEAFKKAMSLPAYYRTRGKVYQAIEDDILRFDNAHMKYSVKFGDNYVNLVNITAGEIDSPEDALVRILDSNEDVRSMFDRACGGEDEGITKEDIMKMGMSELHTKCKESDIPSFGKKKDVVQGLLIEKLGL